MKYDHIVKKNGVYYPAGAEVPEDDYELPFKDEAEPAEDIPFADEQETKDGQITHTRTSINRMSTAELQQLAANVGIDGAEEKSGSELKKELIAYFNL